METASEYEFKKNMTHKMNFLSLQLEDVEHYLKTLSKTDVSFEECDKTFYILLMSCDGEPISK